MTAQDLAILITALAAGLSVVLGAIGVLFVKLEQARQAVTKQVDTLAAKVANGAAGQPPGPAAPP
jgi:hypothetical protein